VELLFAHTYLLLFGKLAVGGLAALAVPPFTELERGFYKSTAAVYLFCAYAMTAGDIYLWLANPERSPVNQVALATWVAFCVLFTSYFATLYVELPFLRARLFPASVFCGIAALAVTAAAYVPAGVGAAAVLVFVIPAIAGAAIVGAGLTGMLLGHWYLIDTGLDLAPFRSILVYCRACLIAEVVSVAAAAAILALWPGTVWEAFAFRVARNCQAGQLGVGCRDSGIDPQNLRDSTDNGGNGPILHRGPGDRSRPDRRALAIVSYGLAAVGARPRQKQPVGRAQPATKIPSGPTRVSASASSARIASRTASWFA